MKIENENINEYTDLRIQKTKESLFQALFASMVDKTRNLEKLKVLDICAKANVTPITFYKHYESKEELIEDAIKNQIINRLPIPSKIKPNNLKQLIYYIIGFFEEYVNKNKEQIISAVNYAANKGYKNTYIDILFKIIIYYVKKEIALIYKGYDNIIINIWTEYIIGGFFYLFIKRIIHKQNTDRSILFNNFKLMNVLFCK